MGIRRGSGRRVSEIEVYGWCPVQGEGWVDGHAWYFRARGEQWSFQVADEPYEEAVSVGWAAHLDGISGWVVRRPWLQESTYAAGWMPHKHALRLISICLRWWREGRLERVEVAQLGRP